MGILGKVLAWCGGSSVCTRAEPYQLGTLTVVEFVTPPPYSSLLKLLHRGSLFGLVYGGYGLWGPRGGLSVGSVVYLPSGYGVPK